MTDPAEQLRPLLRTRQIREFTDEPVSEAELTGLADVARWSGSSANTQPWRFIVITEGKTLQAIAQAGMPQSRSLRTAAAAIAIALPEEQGKAVSHAYDEGRAAERILIGAHMLGLGAGIAWILSAARGTVGELLHIPGEWRVRTVVAIGRPSKSALRPKSPKGQGRLPRDEVVFNERWRRTSMRNSTR
ncbi:MAG: nitroreductase family protein [Chloroflexota bacterium]